MFSAKENLIEYVLERFSKLEKEYEEARGFNRESSILMIQGQMMELNELYKLLTGTNDLAARLMVVLKRDPVKGSP